MRFYNTENYTNFEVQNGTNPVSNDTDDDAWEDGPEVYYMDHDDGMATGWEYHLSLIHSMVRIDWLTAMAMVTQLL